MDLNKISLTLSHVNADENIDKISRLATSLPSFFRIYVDQNILSDDIEVEILFTEQTDAVWFRLNYSC